MALCLWLKETRKLHKYTHTHSFYLFGDICPTRRQQQRTMKTFFEIMAAFDVNQDHGDNFPICGDSRTPKIAELFRNRKIEKYEEKISGMGSFSTFRNKMLVRMAVRRQVTDIEVTIHLLPVVISYCDEGTKWTQLSWSCPKMGKNSTTVFMGQKFCEHLLLLWLTFIPTRSMEISCFLIVNINVSKV